MIFSRLSAHVKNIPIFINFGKMIKNRALFATMGSANNNLRYNLLRRENSIQQNELKKFSFNQTDVIIIFYTTPITLFHGVTPISL